MPTIVKDAQGKSTLVIDVDECSHCYDPIVPGREYCRRCDSQLKAGLAVNQCGFCSNDLPAEEFRDGYCPACGHTLVNPPPYEQRPGIARRDAGSLPLPSPHLVRA